MKWRCVFISVVLTQSWALTSAYGQDDHRSDGRAEAAATQRSYPANVSIGKSKAGLVYVDSRGMTLYAGDTRTAGIFRAGKLAGTKFCADRCADWTALAADAGAEPVGDWKVVEGARGPQWTYKGDLVFTFNADKEPGGLAGDGYDDLWSVIAYTPPAPKVVSPSGVEPILAEGEFVLADSSGRVLYTSSDDRKCGDACTSGTPLTAGLANRPVGDWSVVRTGDRPQWAYRGKPVYISEAGPAAKVPAGAVPLRP